jgi:hypothetical protein
MYTWSERVDEKLTIQRCRIELEKEDAKYGRVRSAELEVSGRLRPAIWRDRKELKWAPEMDVLYYFDSISGEEQRIPARYYADAIKPGYMPTFGQAIQVFLLVLAHEETGPIGLVLRQYHLGVYYRIGLFTFELGENVSNPSLPALRTYHPHSGPQTNGRQSSIPNLHQHGDMSESEVKRRLKACKQWLQEGHVETIKII